MKKILSSVFLAGLGGLFVLAANYFFVEKRNNELFLHSQENKKPTNQTPVTLAGFNMASGLSGNDFTIAAEKSLNAVVHIKTTIEQNNNIAYNPFEEWFYGHSRKQQPYIQQGSGSGVIISANGYIVTNNHVIKNADKIEVTLNDKRDYIAEVVGTDPTTDLALLRVKEKNLPFIAYGNSDDVKVGEWALAVGNPFNLYSTVTAGIISAKGRNINVLEGNQQGGLFPIESFIQTDAAVNPGNSGGALVNASGELIGINTAIASNNGAYQGYAFAIPVNIVKKIVADLVEFGSAQRAYIGVSINDINSKFAEQKNIKQLKGVYINGLTSGGAAEEAGIKIGDVVTHVENHTVNSVSELQEQVSKYRPGDKIHVSLLRNDKEVVLPVVLKNIDNGTTIIKKAEPERASINNLGAIFEEVDTDILNKLKIQNGVRVAKLQNGKLAGAGIKEGFIITSVDKKKVSSLKDIKTILENKTGGVLIEGIYPNGIKAYYGFGI